MAASLPSLPAIPELATYGTWSAGTLGADPPGYDGDGLAPAGFQGTIIEVGFRGGESYMPSYWKNHHEAWPISDAPYGSIFGAEPDIMLSEALQFREGKEKACLWHAAAAYLNALNPEVDYFYTQIDIEDIVVMVYLTEKFEMPKGMFEAANDVGCPL